MCSFPPLILSSSHPPLLPSSPPLLPTSHPAHSCYCLCYLTPCSPHQELVGYYQVNSLGASFPGVDTTLKYPYKEVDQRPRGSSNPPPPPLPPSRPPQPLSSPLQPPSEREQWAEAMFSFTPEYPDEMSIEVRGGKGKRRSMADRHSLSSLRNMTMC